MTFWTLTKCKPLMSAKCKMQKEHTVAKCKGKEKKESFCSAIDYNTIIASSYRTKEKRIGWRVWINVWFNFIYLYPKCMCAQSVYTQMIVASISNRFVRRFVADGKTDPSQRYHIWANGFNTIRVGLWIVWSCHLFVQLFVYVSQIFCRREWFGHCICGDEFCVVFSWIPIKGKWNYFHSFFFFSFFSLFAKTKCMRFVLFNRFLWVIFFFIYFEFFSIHFFKQWIWLCAMKWGYDILLLNSQR